MKHLVIKRNKDFGQLYYMGKLMNSRTALSKVLDILRESYIWLVSIIGE